MSRLFKGRGVCPSCLDTPDLKKKMALCISIIITHAFQYIYIQTAELKLILLHPITLFEVYF